MKKGLMELMQSSCCWVVLWRIWGLVMRVGEGKGVVVERALVLVAAGVVFLEMEMWVFGGDSLFARGVEGIITTRKGVRYGLGFLYCTTCDSKIKAFPLLSFF